MRRQPQSSTCGYDIALWKLSLEKTLPGNEWAEPTAASPGDQTARRHFFYVGTPRRIQQITEEESFLKKDDIQVTSPLSGALGDKRNTEKNISLRSLNPAALPRNSLLAQPVYYSRHGEIQAQPAISKNISKMNVKKDGVASRRWPSKPLKNKADPCNSKEAEDKLRS
ncbi:hypothetical protein XELAEV_18016325mg [Xenopus laevis]|uniref:Uncharacterized protein n=1 Tax=Xenopus laevis TaxID=8355 RepID=A0A974HWU6_XENLA|nr:hypothetical protein XELAEV_18016325mg [Xenopus laevis]